jgi:hypothetical protein
VFHSNSYLQGKKIPCRSLMAADRLDDGVTQTSQIALGPGMVDM